MLRRNLFFSKYNQFHQLWSCVSPTILAPSIHQHQPKRCFFTTTSILNIESSTVQARSNEEQREEESDIGTTTTNMQEEEVETGDVELTEEELERYDDDGDYEGRFKNKWHREAYYQELAMVEEARAAMFESEITDENLDEATADSEDVNFESSAAGKRQLHEEEKEEVETGGDNVEGETEETEEVEETEEEPEDDMDYDPERFKNKWHREAYYQELAMEREYLRERRRLGYRD